MHTFYSRRRIRKRRSFIHVTMSKLNFFLFSYFSLISFSPIFIFFLSSLWCFFLIVCLFQINELHFSCQNFLLQKSYCSFKMTTPPQKKMVDKSPLRILYRKVSRGWNQIQLINIILQKLFTLCIPLYAKMFWWNLSFFQFC